MSRIPLVVGNWKLHKTIRETADFCRALKEELLSGPKGAVFREKKAEAAVAPPFTALFAARSGAGRIAILCLCPGRVLG